MTWSLNLASAQEDAVLGTEQARAVARELDDELPLTGERRASAADMSGRVLVQRDHAVRAFVGRMRETHACLHARELPVGIVVRGHLDQRRSCVARDLRLDLPAQGVLRGR